MFINQPQKNEYSDSLLKMSYTFPLEGHASSVSLREGDLVAFMKKYTPEIDVDAYQQAAQKKLMNDQRYHLQVKVRYQLDKVLEPVFCVGLHDMSFSDTDFFALDGFKDFVEGDNFPALFEVAENIIDTLYKDGALYITRDIDFKDRFWSFDDGAVFDTDFHSLHLKEKAIQAIADHIRQDVELNGESTLAKARKSLENVYMDMSFNSFLNQWPMDVELLKGSDLSYTTFSKFLKKYNLMGNNV